MEAEALATKSSVPYVHLVDDDEAAGDAGDDRQNLLNRPHADHERQFKELEKRQQELYMPGWRGHLHRSRGRLRVILDSLPWQAVIIFIILIDAVFAIIDITVDNAAARYTALGFSCFVILVLLIEALVRLYAWGIKSYFSDWLNWLDILIIIVSIVILIVFWTSGGSFSVYGRVITALIRLSRVLINLWKQRKRLQVAARHIVGENKQRFQEDGFDLDLAYITPRVIVMSVPAIKLEALYRNNIDDVARFFKKRHRNHFKIFNICEERDYSAHYHKFDHQVIRYPVADHNVPTLGLMLAFCEYTEQWMHQHQENVISVHCRGGKGRSGTMICAWLLYSGLCPTAEDALHLFGSKRTDWSKGSKFQGVETQSQCRYIGYFEWVIKNNKTLPSHVPRVSLTKIVVEVSPSLQALARKYGWRKKVNASTASMRSFYDSNASSSAYDSSSDGYSMTEFSSRSSSGSSSGSSGRGIASWLKRRKRAAKGGLEGDDGEDSDSGEESLKPVSDGESRDLEWGRLENAGEEAKWRFRVTHTDGEKLAQPMILYPSWINEEFMIFERELEAVSGSERLEGREKEVILRGDTRLELLGQDERERKERIFLYFWIHTSFMTDSSSASRATTPRSSGTKKVATTTSSTELRQDEGDEEAEEDSELVPMNGGSDDSSATTENEKKTDDQLVMALDKNDVDRGRYKGCPFKKADKVFVRLHYNYDN